MSEYHFYIQFLVKIDDLFTYSYSNITKVKKFIKKTNFYYLNIELFSNLTLKKFRLEIHQICTRVFFMTILTRKFARFSC